jgi:ATP-dependent Clp protease ATP-binding subunit ClpC
MFERYVESSRRVIFFARYEAAQFGSDAIEPHHLLLGLLREARSVVPERLRDAYAHGELQARFEREFPPGAKTSTSVDVPLSQASKRVLAYAAEECDRLAHRYIGPEHLLLGLMRESDTAAAAVLRDYGITAGESRAELADGVRNRQEVYRQITQLPDDRIAAAARLLDALAAEYGTIEADTADGKFTVTFGTPPANV